MLPSSMLGSSKSSILWSSKRGWGNFFAQAPTFGIENWRPSKKKFVQPLKELLSMKLKSFRRG